jgi:MFS-type transporter involved in bile tolerance (Atg22 family)
MLILESFRSLKRTCVFGVRCSTTIMRFGEASGLDWRPVVSALTFVAFFLAAMILFLTSLQVNLQIIGLGPALAFLMGIQCAMSRSYYTRSNCEKSTFGFGTHFCLYLYEITLSTVQ